MDLDSEKIPEIDNYLNANPVFDKDSINDDLKNQEKSKRESKKNRKYSTQIYNSVRTLDLHNRTVIDAEILISDFVNRALKDNLRSVIIVHGKGTHSEGGIAVLRNLVHKMLTGNLRSVVSHFSHLQERDGGQGATEIFFE